MAYLDNRNLWYELFQAGARDAPAKKINLLKKFARFKQRGASDASRRWVDVLESRARFNRAMATLHNYSLLEISEGGYSLHTCVHDWTLEYLNQGIDQERCGIAIRCVAASVSWDTEADYWMRNRRVMPHGQRFQHARLQASIEWSRSEPGDLSRLAALYAQNDLYREAEEMYVRALQGYEKAWGVEHTSTLSTVNNLGLLYKNQGKMAEAEVMYVRALRGKEKAWGPEHMSTLDTVNNLGALYADQGKMAAAEEMLQRALRGYEKAWGSEHTLTLGTVNNLGNLLCAPGKPFEAEKKVPASTGGTRKAAWTNARLCAWNSQ